MSAMRDVLDGCAQRGCRIVWAFSTGFAEDGSEPHIEVDHCTPTTSGSEVFVYRAFPGEIEFRGTRWNWSPAHVAAVAAWVDQLHRMPLEEIP